MVKLCSHFNKLQTEKLGNLFQKKNLQSCDIHKTVHSEQKLMICLECSYIKCEPKDCPDSKQKHKMHLNLYSYELYCVECQKYILKDQKHEDSDEEDLIKKGSQKLQLQKMIELQEKIQIIVKKYINKKQVSVHQQQQQSKIYHSIKLFGLKNLGNSCYFNSVLQCLNACEQLIQIYMDIDFNHPITQQTNDNEFKQIGKKTKHLDTIQSQENQISFNKIFQNFINDSKLVKSQTYDPCKLFNIIQTRQKQFRGQNQQDAQELLRCLIENLKSGEEKLKYQQRTHIDDIFGMYLCNYIKCQNCYYVSRKFDLCHDLIIQIPKQQNIHQKKLNELNFVNEEEKIKLKQPIIQNNSNQQQQINQDVNKNQKDNLINYDQQYKINEMRMQLIDDDDYQCQKYIKINEKKDIPDLTSEFSDVFQPVKQNINLDGKTIKIMDCLDSYFSEEKLSFEKNFYKCEKCKKTKQDNAQREFFLYKPPKMLTLCLKRFEQKSNQSFAKNNQYVEINEYLDLTNYCLVEADSNTKLFQIKYELFALVVHQGNIDGGHYVSYVKHTFENNEQQWFYYSDEQFYQIDIKNILTQQAYILFYKKI